MGNLCAGGTDRELAPTDPIVLALAAAKRELDAGQSNKFWHKYKRGPVLGRGAYGRVVECTHIGSDKKYAVKIIKKGQYARSTLIKEIAITRMLSSHPNSMKLQEVFEDSSDYYLVLERCSGGELFERIVEKRHFSEKNAAEKMRVLLSFVGFAHSRGIVHRDLKPDNILLVDKSDEAAIKVIDFGAGEFCREGERLKQRVGTAYYMAPEVMDNDYDTASDIWSLGVIMFIMLAGRFPFGGATEEDAMKEAAAGRYSFEGEEWKYVTPEAKDMISSMLQVDPSQRATIPQLQQHPWFAVAATADSDLGNHLISQLRNFLAMAAMKRLALLVMTRHMGNLDVGQLKKLFTESDTNGNGLIDCQELQDALLKCRKVGEEALDPAELQRLFTAADIDGSGELDYNEFVAALMGQEELGRSETRVRNAFKEMDKDGDGFITAEEVVKLLPDGCSLEQAQEMIKAADRDGDGKVDYNELQLMMKDS